MKARTLAAILMIVLIMQVIANCLIVKANPYMTQPFSVIKSPEPNNLRTYIDSSVELEIAASLGFKTNYKFVEISYSLDYSSKNPLNITYDNQKRVWTATTTLENLTNGLHLVKAYSVDNYGNVYPVSRVFLVNTSFTYPTFILSPSNSSYSKNEIPLEFIINQINDESVLGIDYKLDNGSTKTVKENITLTDLSEGQHKITATAHQYAYQSTTMYSEQTVYFSVDTKNNQLILNDIPINIIAIPLGALAISSVVALVVYRRMKTSQRMDGERIES